MNEDVSAPSRAMPCLSDREGAGQAGTTALTAAPRLVMVVPTYLPESFGGAEQQTRRISRALAKRGLSVTVIAPRLCRETPSRETDDGVRVRRFRLHSAPNLGGRHLGSFLWWCLCVIAYLWRHRNDYDLIHVIHGRLHAVPAVLAGRWLGKPVVIKPGRGGDLHFDLAVVANKRLLGSVCARSVSRGATAWIANSREIESDLKRWGIPVDSINVIPNGIRVPQQPSPQRDTKAVNFLSMGRLDPEKAIDHTIRAFAALPADAPVRLTILGDGRCRSELEQLSTQLGQSARITFPGAAADVTPYLRDADVYISSSLSEGMSNALLEAMSTGLAPVVSNVSGVAELVEDGVTGLLFPPGDEGALASTLRWAATLSKSRLHSIGAQARKRVKDEFSLDHVAERHVALYRRLLESRP
jgi:glycosyltransferase involved in cell wall biosynthesis